MRVKKPDLGVKWVEPQIPAISGISSQPVPSSVKIREESRKGREPLLDRVDSRAVCVWHAVSTRYVLLT